MEISYVSATVGGRVVSLLGKNEGLTGLAGLNTRLSVVVLGDSVVKVFDNFVVDFFLTSTGTF